MDARTRRAVSQWTARLADGDRAAFDPLFDALWPFVRALARRWLSDDADADDAAQQTLLRVFARVSEYDPARDAVPWIVAIAANECRTLRNRRLRRREDALPDDLVRAEASFEEHQLEVLATELLTELSPDDRAALRAAWFGDGRPDVAPATFRKRVQRAAERLRALWRARHGTP